MEMNDAMVERSASFAFLVVPLVYAYDRHPRVIGCFFHFIHTVFYFLDGFLFARIARVVQLFSDVVEVKIEDGLSLD